MSLVVYLGTIFLLNMLSGQDNLLYKGISAIVFSITMTLIQISISYSIIKRSKYWESSDIAKPPFEIGCSSVINTPQGFDFSRLKTEIASKWEITFSNDTEKVLKCRTKINFLRNWGSAAWMKYDDSTGKVYLECFPMSEMQINSKIVPKMQKEIETTLQIQ